MPTISKFDAYILAKKAGIKFNKDVFTHSISKMSELAAIAKLAGYRKPENANASTGNYFFFHLKRIKDKHGWK